MAGVVVAVLLVGAAVPSVLSFVFPSRIPWDRSLLAVVVTFAVAIPLAGALFGCWVQFAAARKVRTPMALAAAVSVLIAVPACMNELDIKPPVGAALEVGRVSLEPAMLAGDSVVLVTVDTLRASHMSLYGYGRATTPGIEAWATQHTVFTNAITPRTFTAPAVASLMSGVYPGLHGVGRHPDRLPDPVVTLAELFADRGYRTAAFVTNPALATPAFNFGQGFTEWHAYSNDEARAKTVLEDAREFLEREAESPFFLWVHLLDPHSPYRPPAPYDSQFVDDELYGQFEEVEILPARGAWGPREVSLRDAWGDDWAELGIDDEILRSADYLVAQYDGEIAYLDTQLSWFLRSAREAHPEALIALTADHGESLVEHEYFFTHGRFCYEPTARVPLVVAHPRLTPGRVDEVVSLVDLFPTLVELFGLSSPLVVEGRSLSGVLSGTPATPAAHAVRLGARSTNSYPTLCLRSQTWKLILTPRRYTQPLDLLLERHFRLAGIEFPQQFFRAYRTELYDLDTDPGEVQNVETDERIARSELQDKLWASILQQQRYRERFGALAERGLPDIDEDTLRELRSLGCVR